ncbi:hypothetical protein F0562_005713 [Nyssa sinensis]|uniref:Uncharacterized protein n=1 Tax=Nyssa sinensis TaxID=561372 RepID=A0A5J5AL83_9ASTE|nr:hypothetical protein F0562_005713 [Nyssa sinensis]
MMLAKMEDGKNQKPRLGGELTSAHAKTDWAHKNRYRLLSNDDDKVNTSVIGARNGGVELQRHQGRVCDRAGEPNEPPSFKGPGIGFNELRDVSDTNIAASLAWEIGELSAVQKEKK